MQSLQFPTGSLFRNIASSLGPVVNILAIFANANILKK